MKVTGKIKLLLPALLFVSLTVSAQTNVISVDIFGLAHQRKAVSFERTFLSKFSARLSYENAQYSKGQQNGQIVYEVTGQGIIPEFRYYPFHSKKSAPIGFFLGTSFRLIEVQETYSLNGLQIDGSVLNATLIGGYKFVLVERMCLELLAGYGTGKVTGFDDPERSLIDPFFTDSTVDNLKHNFRFEISWAFYFPKIKDK